VVVDQDNNDSMKEKAIYVEDLKRSFKMGDETVHALDGVSFDIEEGEFITIMGSSGSGKSTLLNLIGCLDRPSSGTYKIGGVPVKDLDKNQLAQIRNEKIGFIFQSYNLLPRTTALENVELPLLYNNSVGTEERKKRALDALEKVDLSDRLYHTPSELSGGQQQRVAIARSLVNDPVVILADEATGNLDTKTSYEVMALFQHLNSQGKTIIFVTHEPDIASFSARTIVLKDGKIIKDYKNTNIRVASDDLKAIPKED
jgi:putative ABC transport system ATP-binding protein